MSKEKLWLIKDQKGRILGPYTTKEVKAHIEEGQFQGEELFSPYPLGRWRPLSAHPGFYEKILSLLSGRPDTADKKEAAADLESGGGEEEEILEPTVIMPAPSKTRPPGLEKKQKKVKITFERAEEESAEIIEMEEDDDGASTGVFGKRRKLPRILLISFIFAAAAVFFLTEKAPRREDQIRLLGLEKKRPAWTDSQIKEKTKKALAYYLKSEVPYYLKAQAQLIQILEGNPNFKIGYYYLCLAHFELWPFAYQDTRDRRILSDILNRINKIDRGGAYSGLCNSVSELIKNRGGKALMIIDSSLEVLREAPVFFYYLKARALSQMQKTKEAKIYLQTIYNLAPKWAAPRMLEAGIYYAAGNYSMAAKKYQRILSIFPEHKAAGLRLGTLEHKYFKKNRKSEKRLKFILAKLPDLIDPQILSEAYEAMAQIYRRQNKREEALAYAKKAYALDPSRAQIASLVSSLGGDSQAIKGVKLKTRQLIYKGDILASQRQCRKAQERYKKAYIADGKKNALAAIGMAKCFHRRGSVGQAILWLRRAVSADPKMAEAYFLLVDYLSQNYEFESAREALQAARRSQPSRYEILKSYALLAFRQKTYPHAISYAEQAAKAYSADPEVYVLLHDAHYAMGNAGEAFKAAERAVQEDINSVQGQIAYAKALGSAYGFSRGQRHFEELMRSFPLILEYRQSYGEYFFDNEKYSQAKEIFEEIVSRHPEFKLPYIYLGRIHGFFGKRDGREEEFQEALKRLLKASLLDPSDPEPLFYMGWVYTQANRHHEAESQFEKVLGLNPNYPQINYYIGMANFFQGGGENLERALKSARTEIRKNPNSSLAYILAGDIYNKKASGALDDLYRRRANYELCAKEYQKALKLQKDNIDLYVKLIGCYRGAGDFDSAIQIANQIIRGEGTSGQPEIYRQLGAIYEAKGEYEAARDIYKVYFSLKPNAADRREIEKRLAGYALDKEKSPAEKKSGTGR